jgi:hypothetical protein
MDIPRYEYIISDTTEHCVLYTRRHKTGLTQKIAFILRTELPLIGGRN